MDTVEDFLEHHGIRGMKWGIRRDRSGGSVSGGPHAAAEAQKVPASISGHHKFSKKLAKKSPVHKEVSADAMTFKEIHAKVRTKGLSSLSNAELKKFNERMDMEKKFSKLESEMNAKKNSLHRRLAKKLIESMLDRAISSVAGHVVDAHVEKFKAGPTVAKMLPKPAP